MIRAASHLFWLSLCVSVAWMPSAVLAASAADFLTGLQSSTPGADVTDEPAPAVPSSAPAAGKSSFSANAPYGQNLFEGQFAGDARIGLNPSYRVQAGDHVSVAIWGSGESDTTLNLTVDNQGKIFIPSVGPVTVAGVNHADLNRIVQQHVSRYYQDTVKVYTSLQGSQPVSVYVSGGVVSPGRYSGAASDSLLHYLDHAKGIDPERGSYRRIDVLRNGQPIGQVDVYDFLMRGMIPDIQLKDNDVIFVHPLASTVQVRGNVQNAQRFEFSQPELTGSELLDLARPLPQATHAVVSGIRDGQGFSNYLTLPELAKTSLRTGDSVEFKAGTLNATLAVTISGEHLGPQVVVAPTDAKIAEVLRQVHVDPKLADLSSIYLRRRSVAVRQKEALDASLRRLEESVVSAPTYSEQDAAIQAEEAKLVQMFIKRAKEVEPEGRVVISENGQLKDIALEDGDEIIIPRQTNLVLVNGEVSMPKAVVFSAGQGAEYYVNKAGGYSERADEGRFLIARQNGETVPDASDIRPGDEIIVMPEVRFSKLQVTKDVVDILYKVAIAIAVPLRF